MVKMLLIIYGMLLAACVYVISLHSEAIRDIEHVLGIYL